MPTPLNPFLRAFFRSALPSQCSPVHHHVLLVPTTDCLLNSKDHDSNTLYADLANTEEFLASHVLRIPGGIAPNLKPKENTTVRENKSKARQYSTVNGRTVIIKDTFVYSNKGFKSMNSALLLQDAIYYPDTPDEQQWLVYYIARPLIGTLQQVVVPPAVISDEPSKERRKALSEASDFASSSRTAPSSSPKMKISDFADLMSHFPAIAGQMQPGIDSVIRDFTLINDKPLPKRHARSPSVSSQTSSGTLHSGASIRSVLSHDSSTVHPTDIELEPEEETLRTSMETAVMAAIDLFQQVDKAQLSLLGANTELTGLAVEKMIEQYVAEQVHEQDVFPRLCSLRRPDDSDLDSRLRRMGDIDIGQVDIPFEHTLGGRRQLAARIARELSRLSDCRKREARARCSMCSSKRKRL